MDLGEVALWNKTQGEASLEIKEDEVVLMEILVDIMEILVDLLEMVVLMVEIWDSLVVLVEEVAEDTLPAKFALNQIIQLLIVRTDLIEILFHIHKCRIKGRELLMLLPQKELLIRGGT